MAALDPTKKSLLDCQNGIVQMLKRMGATHDEALEFFCDAIVEYLEKLRQDPDFEPDKGMCAFLSGIAKNLWREELRRRGKAPTLPPPDDDDDDEEQKRKLEFMKECLEELETKNYTWYRIIKMHTYEGLTHEEIGRVIFLNKSKMENPTTTEEEKQTLLTQARYSVSSHAKRARLALKKCIELKIAI